jgi:hypothetical protein
VTQIVINPEPARASGSEWSISLPKYVSNGLKKQLSRLQNIIWPWEYFRLICSGRWFRERWNKRSLERLCLSYEKTLEKGLNLSRKSSKASCLFVELNPSGESQRLDFSGLDYPRDEGTSFLYRSSLIRNLISAGHSVAIDKFYLPTSFPV